MAINYKTLSRFFVAGLLVWIQACASNPITQFFEKPYFETPPAQLAKGDKDLFEKALSRQIYNRVPAAIKAWNQFIEKHPRSFEAHNNLGLVYFEDDQVDQSILSYETALALEPSGSKIKRNLVKVLKFKATLLKEARNYNGAVDVLLRAKEISEGYGKERIGYIIEQYEDKVFDQAKQTNTMEAYEGFLKRFPDSTKNADEARMKIEGLKPVSAGVFELAMKEPQKEEDSSTNGSMDEKKVQESDSQTASSMMKTDSVEMEKDASRVEDSIMENADKDRMEESGSMAKDASGEMEETAEKAEESPSADSLTDTLPEQPQEVARSAEQQVEIATQPEPKPSTAPDIFPTPEPEVSDPKPEEFAKVSPPAKKMVEITTVRDPLRVRKGPSTKSKILATVEKGSQVPFVTEQNGWYKVEFSVGQMGWVSKKYSRLME